MAEPISQAAPQEPVTPESVEAPEITPSQEPQKQTEKPTPAEEKPLTREQILQLVRTETGVVASKWLTKGENRIQKLIQEKFGALEQTKGALGLSDEQVTQAKQKIVTDAYSSTEEPQTEQPTSDTPTADEAIQYINAQIKDVFDEVGVTVTKSDPEFADLQKAVDASWNDPKGLVKILRAADKAATAKAARLQKQNQTAVARVVGGGGERTATTPKLSAKAKISQGLKSGNWNNAPAAKQE